MSKARENWVDAVKIYACVLVVLGHFFQSMTESGIASQNHLLGWFDRTVYFFHVPLFFICSGFLFQKYSCVNSFKSYKDNFIKKLISLGVPYFVFSIATWLLKTVFSGAVNSVADGFFKTLFLKPVSPYWYLYTLIIIFFFAFTISTKRAAWFLLCVTVLMKGISFLPFIKVYAVNTFLSNAVWVALGMLLAFLNPSKISKKQSLFWGVAASVAFVALSVAVYVFLPYNAALSFGMGLVGCAGTIFTLIAVSDCGFVKKIISCSAKYTFPVFLMHTIFAAGLRSVLLKMGIDNMLIHLTFGLAISFAGPVVAAIIMSKIKWLEFLLYPTKFINLKNRGQKNGQKA